MLGESHTYTYIVLQLKTRTPHTHKCTVSLLSVPLLSPPPPPLSPGSTKKHRFSSGSHVDDLLCEVNGNDGCGAAHTRQVVGHDVVLELEVVHNSGRQRRHGVESRAMADDSIDLRIGKNSFSKNRFNGCVGSSHSTFPNKPMTALYRKQQASGHS
jgi:hypothetical protein